MRSWITRPRVPHEWPARWLRMTLLVGLGLGGLAGCATLMDGTTPELGQSLDGVRQEVTQLRAETVQLRAGLRQVEDGLWARDAVLIQLGERLQALEKDVPLLKGPSGLRRPLPAMDVLPAINQLAERLSAVERRLACRQSRVGHRRQRAAAAADRAGPGSRWGCPQTRYAPYWARRSASKTPRTFSSGTMGPSSPWSLGGIPSAYRAGSGLPHEPAAIRVVPPSRSVTITW
jgi:hypothetical protein